MISDTIPMDIFNLGLERERRLNVRREEEDRRWVTCKWQQVSLKFRRSSCRCYHSSCIFYTRNYLLSCFMPPSFSYRLFKFPVISYSYATAISVFRFLYVLFNQCDARLSSNLLPTLHFVPTTPILFYVPPPLHHY